MFGIMISIIIPTFNRKDWLQKAINAILRQADHRDIEIIILDDGSSDGTRQYLKSLADEHNFIKVLLKNRLGPAKLRNLGVSISNAEVLCFLDDDSIPDSGWFQELRDSIKNLDPIYAAVKGFVIPYNNSGLPKFLGEYIHVSDSWATNNIAFRKELFLKAGGFDTQFTFAAWEDLDLGFRLEKMGYKRFYNERMVISHPHEENIKQLKKKFKINGYGYYQFCRKWIKIDPKWIISMWLERIRVLYYLLPGMEHLDYLRYIHGLRIRYEIWGMLLGIFTRGRITSRTKDN